jgi:hypothetical protein
LPVSSASCHSRKGAKNAEEDLLDIFNSGILHVCHLCVLCENRASGFNAPLAL